MGICSKFQFVFSNAQIGWMAILIIVIGLTACKDKDSPSSFPGLAVKVIKSSGDDFSYKNGDELSFFAPYPFTIGKMIDGDQNIDVVILSPQMEKGKQINVLPVASMTLENGIGEKEKVLITQPANPNSRLFEEMDYIAWSGKYFAIKHLIEYWYSNRYGLDGSRLLSWEPANLNEYNR